MSGVREHVHDACGTDVPAAFMVQNRTVTCKRCRVTGHVDHTRGALVGFRKHLRQSLRAFSRGINEHAVNAARPFPERIPVVFAPGKEVPRDKVGFLSKAVHFGAGPRPGHKPITAF